MRSLTSISEMTRLIRDCGWTRENRKLLKSVIGESEMTKLTTAFEGLCPATHTMTPYTSIAEMSDDICHITLGKNHNPLFRLHSDGENIWLKLGIDIEEASLDLPDLKFTNTEINLENIKSAIIKLKESVMKSFGKKQPHARAELEESKILKKLFSQEFTIKPQLNEEGYYLTTIMDRKSGKPVTAYIKELCDDHHFDPNEKRWGLFIRHKNGSYEKLGQTTYGIDQKNEKLTSGWMDSYSGQGDYAGIGVRLHEWRIAQAQKLGYSSIEIVALDEAFPFHHKCGFRIPHNIWEKGTTMNLEDVICDLASKTGMSYEEIEDLLIKINLPNDKIMINLKSQENILIESFCRNGRARSYNKESEMVLKEKKFEGWVEKMAFQPIIPD